MKEKRVVIIITAIVSVLVIAIAITSVFLLSPGASYTRTVRDAENLVADGDYENAVLAYQEAIEKDPENVEAYLGLAEIYEMNGDLLLAIDVLEDGYARTKSSQIRVMLNRLVEEDEEIVEVDGVSLNRSMLSMFSTYREEDYVERYGRSDGRRKARFDGLDAGIMFEDGVPVSIEVDDVLTLFRTDEPFEAELLEDLPLERLRTRNDSEHGEMVVFVYDDMKISIAVEDGMITSSSYNELVPSIEDEKDEDKEEDEEEDEEEEEVKTILYSGVTTDYLTDEVMGNVSMTVYRGRNNSGQKYLDLSSNENGEFQVNLECGRYFYIELKKGEYSGDRWLYIGDNDIDVEDVNLQLTKPLDDISVILEWQSEEVELISELVTYKNGEMASTKDTGEIAGIGGETAAYRDVRDTGGMVVDVTTIVDDADRYVFYVHRTEGDGTFGDAGAKVTVQVPGMPDVVVEVKPEIIGEYWCVFAIDHGKVDVVNYGVEGYGMY